VLPRRSWLAGLGLVLLLWSSASSAADQLLRVASRPDVSISYWWMPRDSARATVVLFSGGSGGIGYRDGEPKSGNFLIRSRDEFAKAGFNVALVGNPSDMPQLNPVFRQSAEHMADVRAILVDIRQRSSAPVWVIGTSKALSVPQPWPSTWARRLTAWCSRPL